MSAAGVRIARLSITPIKGTALHHPRAVTIRSHGATGDRAFFMVEENDKLFSMSRSGAFAGIRAETGADLSLYEGDTLICRGPVRPAEPIAADFYGEKLVPGRVVPGPWTTELTARAGRPIRLVKADHPGAGIDWAPVTLVGSGSVAKLEDEVGEPVDPRRFRMLIDLETDEPHVEDSWRGARLSGEEVVLIVGEPVPRCAAVTRHPDRGERDQPLVRAIKDYRGLQQLEGSPVVPFGVYAEVAREGRLEVGEVLTLSRRDMSISEVEGGRS